MNFCSNCGNELKEGQDVCLKCGTILKSATRSNDVVDSGSIGWAFLGFFQPIIGLIIYLIWKDERPLTAKSAAKGALISVITGAVLTVLYFVIFIIIAIAAGSY